VVSRRQTTVERIRQLRLNMLVHSYIYYTMNESLISDHEWQRRADELVALQAQHTAKINCYDAAFDGWDASTGYHLPADHWVQSKADYLLRHFSTTYVPPQPAPRRRGLLDST